MQKVIKRIIKVSKASAKNVTKNFRKLESFIRKIEKICLSLSTVAERSVQELIRFVEILFNFWGLNSNVTGLFIDFLTSGLSFVKHC